MPEKNDTYQVVPPPGYQGVLMKVGDLVEYIAAPRIAIKTGDIGCVENIVYTQNTKIYHVRTLSNGKLRRFNKHHLKVVQ